MESVRQLRSQPIGADLHMSLKFVMSEPFIDEFELEIPHLLCVNIPIKGFSVGFIFVLLVANSVVVQAELRSLEEKSKRRCLGDMNAFGSCMISSLIYDRGRDLTVSGGDQRWRCSRSTSQHCEGQHLSLIISYNRLYLVWRLAIW